MFDITDSSSVSKWAEAQERGALLQLESLQGLPEEEVFEEVASIVGGYLGKMEWIQKSFLAAGIEGHNALKPMAAEMTHRMILATDAYKAYEIIKDTASDIQLQLVFIAGGLQNHLVFSRY